MNILALLLLIPAIVAYSISQLAQHGKLRWSPSSVMSFDHGSFWGSESWKRKYKYNNGTPILAPDNWYYRFFKIKYKERFPLSTTMLVFLTDGYHHMQFWMFNFLALAFTVALGFNWWLLLGMLIGVRLIHGVTYKLLSR